MQDLPEGGLPDLSARRSRLLGGRSPDEVQEAAHGRTRELFWLAIFFVVMATSLLAAARRWAGQLKRAIARPERREP